MCHLNIILRMLFDVTIKIDSEKMWRATFVYGEPRTELRYQFWDLLRFIRTQWSGPWLCAGDFNEVLSRDEHMSKVQRGEHQMKLFSECLEDCELVDLGFSGPKFTWNNIQSGDNNVKVRLDRATANGQFMELFNDYHVENIITYSSDHYAVLTSIGYGARCDKGRPISQNFRYESMWARASDYVEVVQKSWVQGFDGPINI